MFNPPANEDDLSDFPQLKAEFIELWNSTEDDGSMGRYVSNAASRSPNYVDPRIEAPVGDPVKIPWNGFPKLLSRWFDDENSDEKKEDAEKVAEILTPILSWVLPVPDGAGGQRLQLFSSEAHRVPFFISRRPEVAEVAQPLRRILDDDSLGDEVPRFRRQQDEYLEWHPTLDDEGRLVKLTFTAEPPDYWLALAQVAPDRVVDLYKEYVDSSITKNDLFHQHDLAAFGKGLDGQLQWFNIGGKGSYDELNEWTTTKGIMHLTHRANTLGAEVNLASDASLVFASDNAPAPVGQDAPPPEIRRIACGEYGGINRSSDPLIGQGVAGAVKSGARITLTDPVGLYIANVNLNLLTGPENQPVGNMARDVIRGEDDPFDPRILRFEVRLPDDSEFRLDECTFEGRTLKRGGQIARQTTVHLYANVYPDNGDTTENSCQGRPCRNNERPDIFLIGNPNVGADCPTDNNPIWLLQTPQLTEMTEDTSDAGLFDLAVPVERIDLESKVEIPPTLATKRADMVTESCL